MGGVSLAWVTYLAVATWRYEQGRPGTLPPPKIYVGSAVVFSILGAAAGPAPGPATAFSWALVVAALVTGVFLPPAGQLTLPPATAGAAKG